MVEIIAECRRLRKYPECVTSAVSRTIDVALGFPLVLPPTTCSCAEVAEWETALELLAQLRAGQLEEGGEPLDADTVSFNATINALGRGGQWKKAVALLREMSKAGLRVKVCFCHTCFPGTSDPTSSDIHVLLLLTRLSSALCVVLRHTRMFYRAV